MKKSILFNTVKNPLQKKLSIHIYIDIINNHDTKLIIDNFTWLKLIYIERALKKLDSMSEEEIQELNRE